MDGKLSMMMKNSIKLDFLDPAIPRKKAVELVSAISSVNSDLIYAGTIYGKVNTC